MSIKEGSEGGEKWTVGDTASWKMGTFQLFVEKLKLLDKTHLAKKISVFNPENPNPF